RMRQRVDANAEFTNGIGLLEHLAIEAARSQHQCGGQATYAAADDNRLHRPYSTPEDELRKTQTGSHGPSLRRKRLCRLGFELCPGLRLSLNFQVLEILPVPDAVAEDLLLARQILWRTEHVGAVPGGGLHGEGGIDQMRTAERH